MEKRQMSYRLALAILAVAMVSALGGYGVALLGGCASESHRVVDTQSVASAGTAQPRRESTSSRRSTLGTSAWATACG